MSQEDKIVKIESYLLGRMSEDERKVFEREVRNDEDLQALMQEMKKTLYAIKMAGRENLRLKVSAWDQEMSPITHLERQTERSKSLPYLLAFAAAIALIVISIFVIRNQEPVLNHQELFAEHFTPYADITGSRERSSSESTPLSHAMGLYADGKYQEALVVLEQLSEEEKQNELIIFYLANAQLALRKSTAARENLHDIKGKMTALNEQIDWYIALSYVQENKPEEAIIKLDEIINSESAFRGRAKALHSKIKR